MKRNPRPASEWRRGFPSGQFGYGPGYCGVSVKVAVLSP